MLASADDALRPPVFEAQSSMVSLWPRHFRRTAACCPYGFYIMGFLIESNHPALRTQCLRPYRILCGIVFSAGSSLLGILGGLQHAVLTAFTLWVF